MKRPRTRRDRNTHTRNCNSPTAHELKYLDSVGEVRTGLDNVLGGHSNSTVLTEALGWSLINAARELRQARRPA